MNQTYVDPGSGHQVKIGLSAFGESPNELYVYGGMFLSVAGFGGVNLGGVLGGPGGYFIPGQQGGGRSDGEYQGSVLSYSGQYLISYDIGFNLPMPSDGVSINAVGTWWANHSETPVPSLRRHFLCHLHAVAVSFQRFVQRAGNKNRARSTDRIKAFG